MRVLVTGASGFIGAHVTRALLARGHEVAAIALPDENPARLQDVLDRVVLLRGSLTELEDLRPAIADFHPDACLHLAWYAEPGKYLNSPLNVPMLTASLALLQMLGDLGCVHFIGAGTCAEYDLRHGWLKEEGSTQPETIYAATKLSLCLSGQQLASLSGMTFAWGRIFYPYGPQEDPRRMVPALIRALLAEQPFPASAGTQVRDYVHVEDIGAGFCLLLEQKAAGIYNIGSGEPITVRRLMETIAQIVGHGELIQFGAMPVRAWEPPFICADMQKMRALGWNPRYDLREGLTATAQWWRQQL